MTKKTKKWLIQPRTKDDLIEQLLVHRGVIDPQAFLHPDYATLHDPMKMKDMDRLVDRLNKAIANNEKIGIFGDYDHDGTPAAALLSDGITTCGGTVASVYIPTREEGYSLSLAVIDLFISQGITLLTTVDCGITNKPEIDYAVSKGLDSIVIDHHVVQEDKYPDAAIVVNPKQKGDEYPFKELCGCGLAFKAIQVLGRSTNKIDDGQMKWYLDLVAISTLCDMVPLVDENRILVHFGIMVLRKTKRLGLKKLYLAAAIDPKTISPYTVGFVIGPRLNAPGRMERASIAYELLVATKSEEAEQLANKLNKLNSQRQDELDAVLKAAEKHVEENKLHDKKVIVVSGEGWNDGVVGLVAGRLMEKYARPSIVLSRREDGLAKGSARSIEGFHLVETLQQCEQYLVKYGGHARAAGLTLAKEHLELLYDKLIEIAESNLTEESLQPRVKVDASLKANEVNLVMAERLALLEPHGFGNPKPIFLIEAAEVIDTKVIGSTKKHLKIRLLLDEKIGVDAVAFNMAERSNELPLDGKIDLVGLLDINEWQGRQSVQIKVLDWKLTAQESDGQT